MLSDVIINAATSFVFASAGPAIVGLRNAGKSVLKPLLKESTEITFQAVLNSIGEESVSSGTQSIFSVLLDKISNLLAGGK